MLKILSRIFYTLAIILIFLKERFNFKLIGIKKGSYQNKPKIKQINKLFIFFFLYSISGFSQLTTNTITFNYTGSAQNFLVPQGVTSIEVEAWGGGGAGAGGTGSVERGGGGGGGYTKFSFPVIAGTTYAVNVGKGGIGNSNPGEAGGESNLKLGSTFLIRAYGGNGGNNTNGGAGGAMGFPTSGTGLVRTIGGNGGNGARHGGGGGGSAGNGGNGGTGGNANAGFNFFGTVYGSSPGGGGTPGAGGGASGGNGGSIASSGVQTANPGDGNQPGAGGGGRASNGGNGGNGGNGRIIISYVITTSDLSITNTVSNSSTSPNEIVTFTIIAKNERTYTVLDVEVTDILPSGFTFISANQANYDKTTGKWVVGNLTANATSTLTISALVKSSGTYNNTATIVSNTMPDDTTGNNSATANVAVCKAGNTAPQVTQ